ncbi:MAG: DUF1211 domain-containing protein [Solirubrobacterales bacterium]|nr:DUF1211 domain-containing protein [Solirubrobacterales bacterium]
MFEEDEDSETPSERAFDYARTVALSDGVFAIALTLLVFTITFPELQGVARRRLGHELENRLPELFSWALSFAVLGLLWLRHHGFFRDLRTIDARMARLNLVYLALIAFLPYPTRLVGQYGNRSVAVVSYAATVVLIGLVTGWMRIHASRAGLLPPSAVGDWRDHALIPVVFLLSIPVAMFVSADLAKWCWLLAVIVGLLMRGRRRSGARRRRRRS